jgi:hypothetical protein
MELRDRTALLIRVVVFFICDFDLASAQDVANSTGSEADYYLAPIEVVDSSRKSDWIGVAQAASAGSVTQEEIRDRPLLRPGEILEAVPGLMVSQHSGLGKANQYYLRGFNLDHGTDFLTLVDGMPINLPTHAHGHGYTDLNFLIPELVERIDYRKGPYYANSGDFASAGSARIDLLDELEESLVSVTSGTFNYLRALAAGSSRLRAGNLLYAVESEGYDGPWDEPQDSFKLNGVLKYSTGNSANRFKLTALGYNADWNSTDQIPLRAIRDDSISRFGAVDPTDGGNTSRYSLIANWSSESDGDLIRANLYGYRYTLDLFSNFTYFLSDPVSGDQFEQVDRRWGIGGDLEREITSDLGGVQLINLFGFRVRNDIIPEVGLYSSKARARVAEVRSDKVNQNSIGVFGQWELRPLEKLRASTGVSADLYSFDVDSGIEANSGNEMAGIVNPKFGLAFNPLSALELYLNAGSGFHSNDARGTTLKVDPTNPALEAQSVTPLARTKGGELGARFSDGSWVDSVISLWLLDLDSELIFLGDAGTTEPSRPSRRYGVELTNSIAITRGLTLDGTLALSQARFSDNSPEGDYVPGAAEAVLGAGVEYDLGQGFFAATRLRHFGPRALIEDNSERSTSTSVVNARLGYRLVESMALRGLKLTGLAITLDLLNLFDSSDSDIDYYYTSRLPGEPTDGVADRHLHPIEPLSFRLGIAARY